MQCNVSNLSAGKTRAVAIAKHTGYDISSVFLIFFLQRQSSFLTMIYARVTNTIQIHNLAVYE